MNYIQKLEGKARANDVATMELKRQLDAIRIYLNGPKFTGTDTDGGRKDWIATRDVLSLLETVETRVREAQEAAEYDPRGKENIL